MTKVCDVLDIMERWAPSQLAEPWDNTGLITGNPHDTVDTVVVALDVLEETVSFARENRASLIISHHPPLFRPLKKLTGDDLSSRVLRYAVKENISLYASHTNLDQAPGGVSHALAERLGLSCSTPLSKSRCDRYKFVTFVPPDYTDKVRDAAGAAGAGVIGEYRLCSFSSRGLGTYIPSGTASPYEGEADKLSRSAEDRLEMVVPVPFAARVVEEVGKAHPYEEMAYDLIPLVQDDPSYGYGALGDLADPLDLPEFLHRVAESLGVETLHVSRKDSVPIRRVAVMGGSGKDYIASAVSAEAHAFVTGGLGHHDFLDNRYINLVLIDATHRATEIPVLDAIKKKLETSSLAGSLEILIDPGSDRPAAYEWKE